MLQELRHEQTAGAGDQAVQTSALEPTQRQGAQVLNTVRVLSVVRACSARVFVSVICLSLCLL